MSDTQRNTAYGFLQVITSKVYDHKKMVRQMEKHYAKFNEQALANDYAREYERIYNFASKVGATRLF